MTKTFIIRVLSALAAVAVLFGAYYFLDVFGLQLICYFAVLVGGTELIQILFPYKISRFHKVLFYTFLLLIFHMASQYPSFSVVGFSLLAVLFFVLSIMSHHKFEELETLVKYQAKSVLGFVYLGLLPSFAYRILSLPHDLIWFLTLLAVVFGGDIGAYIVGVLVGKHKINPRISPKKTWEGAMGGLAGSLSAGLLCSHFLPQIQLSSLLITALCAGFVAQCGDFFESLIKRVADVKDSGNIMPGHGGVLDRLDGVLFACPVVMIVASLFESF